MNKILIVFEEFLNIFYIDKFVLFLMGVNYISGLRN